MALKTIFEIEVDDTKFRKFKELFDSYKKNLEKVPGAWKNVKGEIGESKSLIDQLIQAAADQSNNDSKRNQSAKANAHLLFGASRLWTGMTASVGGIEKSISSITSKLAKWGTLTAVFTGLLGAGSLFGIDKLANAVASNRRSAMGMGIGYGQQQAFNANYSRLINSGSFLSNLAGAKYDLTSPAYTALLSLGVPGRDIQNRKTGDLAVETLDMIDRNFKGITDKGMIGAKAHAMGIDNLMSLQELVAYISASDSEKKSMRDKYASDSKGLDLSDETTRKWQDLVTQLERAGKTIETVFIDKLTPLIPALEKLSESIIHFIKVAADSGTIKHWIEYFAAGANKLADWLNDKSHQEKVEWVFEKLAESAKSLLEFATGVGSKVAAVIPDSLNPVGSAEARESEVGSPSVPSPSSPSPKPSYSPRYRGGEHGDGVTSSPSGPAPTAALAKSKWLMEKMMKDFDLTPEQAAGAVGWMMAETDGTMRPDIVRKGGTDTGWAQWVGSRRTGLLSLGEPTDETNYAWMKHELETNYSGALRKLKQERTMEGALRSWGKYYEGAEGTPGGLDWQYGRHLPHANRVWDNYRSSGKMPTVTINPATGSNPNTSAAMANQYATPAGN